MTITKARRLAFTIVTVLLAAACADTGTVSSTASFNKTSKNALVVMGVSASEKYWIKYTFFWWKIDPGTGELSENQNAGHAVTRNAEMSGNRAREIRYLVFSVPPGKYGLAQVRALSILDMSGEVPSFEVKAGEAVYIGNFRIAYRKLDRRFRFRVIPSGYSLAGAQKFMANYPGIRENLIKRRISKIDIE